MLILSRKCGEIVMIGDDVEIHVLDIGAGKVRLGVIGPAWMPVHNRERLDLLFPGKRDGDRVGRGEDACRLPVRFVGPKRPFHSTSNSR